MYSNIFYNKYKKNIHSQNGEDGIIEELLKRLGISGGWVCEFGAWDGIHLSNTFALIEKGFSGVYIEGDVEKYNDLLRTCSVHKNIVPVRKFVSHTSAENSLDSILDGTPIPKDFDVLSIDIDSFDYQVWESFTKFQPKLVVIEINSGTDPNNTEHIHSPGKYAGTSFLPMRRLGESKGYKFVLHTGNMIFVRNDLFDKLNIKYDNVLENFRTKWLGRT
jgi:hypothetical protein